MLTMSDDHGRITVIKLACSRLTSADFGTLRRAQVQAVQRGRSAFLVDLSAVRRITRSGLAGLVEFQSAAPREVVIGFFGACPAVAREIDRCALSRLLTVFETRAAALAAPAFRARRLAGMKAVVLVAGAGRRMAPLSAQTPKPLLDLMGRPVLEHVMAHLAGFGLRDVLINPGHLGPQFHARLSSAGLRPVQFFNEGRYLGPHWQAAPLGSASTLLAMQMQLSAFDEDFVVMCGDAISTVDLAEMASLHRRSGADVTLAVQQVPRDAVQNYGILEIDAQARVTGFVEKPTPEQAPSRLASTGIYIFHPRALRHLAYGSQQDIAHDLLPAILAAGGRIQAYQGAFDWCDIGCPRDYFLANSRALRGLLPQITPQGREIRRHVWAAPGAVVAPRAVIVGPCFIGADAVVEAGAKLEGPTVIGAGAHVSSRALVRRSIVMEQTAVAPGSWVDDMIVSGDWAVDHRFADGSEQPQEPMEGVSWCGDRPIAAHNREVTPAWRVAQ
ncbi:NTP transferase domain-containing protein [Shimia sp. R11_0]|uniref:sugar phosphate nucleotidyltransferase n=1 Tax=Shimia sp. R11_0 TaxID=2821096 RepID=UPI001ADB51D4|nr:sugar phosphate nucleotidyltransferase [Shimia sp. R11_0]MBO9478212.1 NTP transferase domain-containing protein [Shimia sp. R11_0]